MAAAFLLLVAGCVSPLLSSLALADEDAGDLVEPSRASALLPPEPARACCAPDPAPVAEKSCCPPPGAARERAAACPTHPEATPRAESASSPLSARSLYQLEAAWTDDSGSAFAFAQLRGCPVVVAMFFASCEYACPILTYDMQRIRDGLTAGVREQTRFVLVSFDDVRDTPAALKAYRERARLDGTSWTLLRGGPDEVQELAMLLGVKFKQDARGQFSHSNLITVLDPEGEIVHQRPGLQGEVATAIRAVTLAAK